MVKQSGWVQKLSIRWRVWSLLILSIATLFGVWLTISNGMRSFNQAQSAQSFYSDLQARQQRIDYLALQLRRNEKDFLLRRNEDYVKYFDKNHESLMQEVSGLVEMVEPVSIKNAVHTIQDGMDSHKRLFKKVAGGIVTLGLNEKLGLQGALRRAVHGIEELLKQHKSAPLQVKMLMMRRHEKDFIMRKKSKYIDSIIARQTEFLQILEGVDFPKEVKTDMIHKLDVYVTTFQKYAAARLKSEKDIIELSAEYRHAFRNMPMLASYAATQQRTAKETFEAEDKRFEWMINLVVVVSLLILIPLGLLIIQTTVRQLSVIRDTLNKLSAGEYDAEIPYSELQNEVGSIARASMRLRDSALERMELEAKVNKDMLERAEEKRREEEEKSRERREKMEQERAALADKERKAQKVECMINDFEGRIQKVVKGLSCSAVEMRSTSEDMVTIAEGTGTRAHAVRDTSGHMQQSVGVMAAAIDEFSTSIAEVSRQMTTANTSADQAVSVADKGSHAIEKLSQTSRRIEDVVKLINDIAEQTNLLALNATIEAARAGDAGKGFAVVASEVKNLATQTATATGDISSQISDMQHVTTEAVEAIQSVSSMINGLNDAMVAISAAVDQQQASTDEIRRSVELTAEGTEKVNQEIYQVSDGAERTGTASADVMTAAKNLEDLSITMTDEINRFLENVRSVS